MRLTLALCVLALPLVPACGPGGGDTPALLFHIENTELDARHADSSLTRLRVARLGGFEGEVTIHVTDLPPDGSFYGRTFEADDDESYLTIYCGEATPVGTFTVQVHVSGDGVATVSAPLQIRHRGPSGTLDTDFGFFGTTTTSIVTPSGEIVGARANGMTVTNDDRIVVVGTARVPIGVDDKGATVYAHDVCLVRYLSNGQLDETFGNAGIVLTRIGSVDDLAHPPHANGLDVIQTIAGDFVVVGRAVPRPGESDELVLRYRWDGSLNTTFAGTGIKLMDFGDLADNHGAAVTEDRNGKLVVVGWTRHGALSSVMSVTRYDGLGRLDPTFGPGGTGYRLHAHYGLRSAATGIYPGYYGSLLVSGWADVGGREVAAILKLDESGDLDGTFAVGGEFLLPRPGQHHGLDIDFDGLLVGDLDGGAFCAGLDEVGALIPAFGDSGVRVIEIEGGRVAFEDLHVGGRGTFYAAGTLDILGGTSALLPVDHEALIWEFSGAGTSQAGFGTDGILRVRYDLTLPSTCVGIDEMSDNTLVIAGTANPEFGMFAVAHIW